MFEPGVNTNGTGGDLAKWSITSRMDYIGEPGEMTHCDGYVIDLSFTNIPFAELGVRKDLHCGSNHDTIVTAIPERGAEAATQARHTVADAHLETFGKQIHVGLAALGDPWGIGDARGLDEYVKGMEVLFASVIATAGKLAYDAGRSAPW